MNSEKVKEIKKALEFQRDGLPYLENNCVEVVYCKDILTLINELEQCSKKWQKLCADEVALNTPLKERIKELETLCNKTYEDLTKEIDRLESENEKLKQHKRELQGGQQDLTKRIAELKKENGELKQDLKKSIDMQKEFVQNLKTATKEVEENLAKEIPNLLKQFAERLKEEAFVIFMGDIIIRGSKVDEVLNEFIFNDAPKCKANKESCCGYSNGICISLENCIHKEDKND